MSKHIDALSKLFEGLEMDLPGMWSTADFEGGRDEVRGPEWTPAEEEEPHPDDIVTRLRKPKKVFVRGRMMIPVDYDGMWQLMGEAANEIEQLRKEREELRGLLHRREERRQT